VSNLFPINRVVVLLTPVFASVSGLLATQIGEWIPGANLDEAEITALFVTGATAALAAAYKWVDGWQKHEASEAILGSVPPDGS
jgi:hypothetical protein